MPRGRTRPPSRRDRPLLAALIGARVRSIPRFPWGAADQSGVRDLVVDLYHLCKLQRDEIRELRDELERRPP